LFPETCQTPSPSQPEYNCLQKDLLAYELYRDLHHFLSQSSIMTASWIFSYFTMLHQILSMQSGVEKLCNDKHGVISQGSTVAETDSCLPSMRKQMFDFRSVQVAFTVEN
jgi:hypothetical protein